MIKTRSLEEYHITTDEIWRTIHSNTSQVYLERAKLLYNTTARWQADQQTIDGNMLKGVWQQLDCRIDSCGVTEGADIEHLWADCYW
jgi:hypothetical protein